MFAQEKQFHQRRKDMKSWTRFFVLGVMSISFALSGCGGGGGGGGGAPVLPGAPTGVTALGGPGQARITWDNVAGATSYNLDRKSVV